MKRVIFRIVSLIQRTALNRYVFALFVFVVLMKLISIFALSAFAKVEIIMTSSTGTPVRIFFTGGNGNFSFSEKFSIGSMVTPEAEESKIPFRLVNSTIENLRIDPGTAPGDYSISSVTLHSFFGSPVILTPQKDDLRVETDPQSRLITTSEAWRIQTTGNDPQIIFSGNLQTHNPFINYLLPAIIAFAVFLFSANFKLKNCSVIQDITSKHSSKGDKFIALDGVRGLAALLVLGDHVGWPPFSGLGPIGVVVFFCLSGFLLSMPFAKYPHLISEWEYVKNYLLRRLKRIVPMFYFICIVGYLFQGHTGDFLRTIVFIQANGVLWTVLQELYFYALLPLVMILNYYLFRGKLSLCAFFLLLLTFACSNNSFQTFRIYANGSFLQLHIGLFLSGVLTCYIFHTPFIQNNQLIKRIADNHFISLILLILLFSTQSLHQIIQGQPLHDAGWVYTSNYGIFIGILLLFIILSKHCLLSRFFSFYPLRAIGIVGYSFYLLHPILLQPSKVFFNQYLGIHPPSALLFGVSIALTYVLSAITYTYIERPFLGKMYSSNL